MGGGLEKVGKKSITGSKRSSQERAGARPRAEAKRQSGLDSEGPN
jgi:hypothetical protein